MTTFRKKKGEKTHNGKTP